MLHDPATKFDTFEEIIFNLTEKFDPVTKTTHENSRTVLKLVLWLICRAVQIDENSEHIDAAPTRFIT